MKTKEKNKAEKRSGHNPDYDELVPAEIFEIEDSDEVAEMWNDMFGY